MYIYNRTMKHQPTARLAGLVPQCVVVCCCALQCVSLPVYSVLQCVAVCCSMLQCVAARLARHADTV